MEYNIKELRTKLGWNQEQLARYLNTTIATVSRWENNVYKPGRQLQEKLDKLIKKHKL